MMTLAERLTDWEPKVYLDLPLVLIILLFQSSLDGITSAVLAGSKNRLFAYSITGLYVSAQKIGRTLPGRLWTSFFPGKRESLATVLDLAQSSQYVFYGLLSGTQMKPYSNIPDLLQKDNSDQRNVIRINSQRSSTQCTVDVYHVKGGYQNGDVIQNTFTHHQTFISLVASVATICIHCVIYYIGDFYAFAVMSLLSACTFALTKALSSGGLKVSKYASTNVDIPVGLGLLSNGSNHLKLLVGEENDVNCITKTKLELKPKSSTSLGVICVSIHILTLAQLFVIPQALPATQALLLLSYLIGYIANFLYSSYDLNDTVGRLIQTESGTKYVTTIVANNRAAALSAVSLLTGAVNEDVYQSLLAKETEWNRWILQLKQVAAKTSDQWRSELQFTKHTKYTMDIEAAIEGVVFAISQDESLHSFQKYSHATVNQSA
ncbi:hypothetical protein K450DRAFT_226286 [Umbelopsis ramanniana AG]|uniref:Uncharacterized protein n=1 Tax=Umbelopsis ramanniana AG TaxID=1314678 RepID=A0AAD5EFY4_UMBRA|nr:uncharacterized protein K450DRAFT_226286 [Umbelopsis ramanniana AG]KAI8582642.1 hypothetical protein K450DRAFT_226286 [Umbelopsis ramanniana AG]